MLICKHVLFLQPVHSRTLKELFPTFIYTTEHTYKYMSLYTYPHHHKLQTCLLPGRAGLREQRAAKQLDKNKH